MFTLAWTIPFRAVTASMLAVTIIAPLAAQERLANAKDKPADAVKVGYFIDVPIPLNAGDADQLIDRLTRLNELAPEGKRVTVVLRYKSGEADSGAETQFEDALKVARAMTGPPLRRVRIVSLVEREIVGHSNLPIVASEMILVSNNGSLANASAADSAADETIGLFYGAIASKRGLFPPAVVSALVDPGLELALISKVGGEQVFATGNELKEMRDAGDVLNEEVWSAAGLPLQIDAMQLRAARIAAALVPSMDEAAVLLDLGELKSIEGRLATGEATGVLLDITGSIASNRVRRWQSNLSSTLTSGEINTWVIQIDSGGGSLDDSATLASWFADPEPPLRVVAGLVRGEARGDAALVAVSCKPLYMTPDSRIGGPGADSISLDRLAEYDPLITQIAVATKRPAALIRGMLNSRLNVYRYSHRKTGRIRYATEDDIIPRVEDPDAGTDEWIRGEQVDLAGGLSATEAIALGLVDGESPSLEDTSRRVGLAAAPKEVADRGLVRFVENLGRSQMLAFLLIFIGFTALSTEASAPGLGFPGFLGMVCFALWFWIQFLAGTAEWLELVVFSLGIVCIGIEIFVVPGFGVFGVGGLALTVLGLVLMSQTFVIPRNVYQLSLLNRGVWVALGGAAGMFGGFVAMRYLFPHVPMLRGLVMEADDESAIHESEKLGDYSALLGQVGTATTPLRPSGKARFGDQIIQVISDGTLIAAGDSVRVTDVHTTKVVVESVENG